jgi:hypothetical protein
MSDGIDVNFSRHNCHFTWYVHIVLNQNLAVYSKITKSWEEYKNWYLLSAH